MCNDGKVCWQLPEDFVPDMGWEELEEHIARLIKQQA